ncbi:hypothetical protein [Ilyobacter polytropus]|uniref:Uncharacterized protein n=1 Tax=Ilyobacter polytropus (strain ATCC 51220 / DSM 2926 / LMG 16218 / CuHBu1) TaxID=572544 RepID=E3HE11_ILYPC|nr:hypothetical protein [Ilyobacter polytropus]ADO84623.1 hypothetical protein Ilyop_2876 [Ilyobacter polytropus DSM 2926]
MKKNKFEDIVIRIKHKIIKDNLGITDNSGIVSEKEMDGEWFEPDLSYFIGKGERPDE